MLCQAWGGIRETRRGIRPPIAGAIPTAQSRIVPFLFFSTTILFDSGRVELEGIAKVVAFAFDVCPSTSIGW